MAAWNNKFTSIALLYTRIYRAKVAALLLVLVRSLHMYTGAYQLENTYKDGLYIAINRHRSFSTENLITKNQQKPTPSRLAIPINTN